MASSYGTYLANSYTGLKDHWATGSHHNIWANILCPYIQSVNIYSIKCMPNQTLVVMMAVSPWIYQLAPAPVAPLQGPSALSVQCGGIRAWLGFSDIK